MQAYILGCRIDLSFFKAFLAILNRAFRSRLPGCKGGNVESKMNRVNKVESSYIRGGRAVSMAMPGISRVRPLTEEFSQADLFDTLTYIPDRLSLCTRYPFTYGKRERDSSGLQRRRSDVSEKVHPDEEPRKPA